MNLNNTCCGGSNRTLSAVGNLDITAVNGAITRGGSLANLTGAEILLSAGAGGINYGGTATATRGNYSFSSLGSINVTPLSGNNITLRSVNGALTDANGAGTLNLLSTGTLDLTAATGIDLDIAANNVNATLSGTGNIVLREADGANLLQVVAPSGTVNVSSSVVVWR